MQGDGKKWPYYVPAMCVGQDLRLRATMIVRHVDIFHAESWVFVNYVCSISLMACQTEWHATFSNLPRLHQYNRLIRAEMSQS